MLNSSSNSTNPWVRWIPFVFVVLWSTGFIGAKFALPYAEPFNILLIRMLITMIVFAALALVMRSHWPTYMQIMHQMVVGSLVHAAYLGGVFAAIKLQMPASVAALLVSLQPLLTAVLAWAAWGEGLRIRQWVGMVAGLLGVALVLLSGESVGDFTVTAMAFTCTMVALFGISIGTLYQKKFGAGVDLITGSFFQYLGTALWMAVLAFSFETRVVIWHPQLILALAWLVFGLSVTAVLLLLYMIREGEAAKVASYFYLVPLVTAIQAWLFFGEAVSPIGLLGIIITVFGVFLVLKAPASEKNKQNRASG